MLAKVWKKALFAICIIACIYNVMNKLVSRTSLEIQLRSVQNQSSLMDVFNQEEKEETPYDNEINSNAAKQSTSKSSETIVVIY